MLIYPFDTQPRSSKNVSNLTHSNTRRKRGHTASEFVHAKNTREIDVASDDKTVDKNTQPHCSFLPSFSHHAHTLTLHTHAHFPTFCFGIRARGKLHDTLDGEGRAGRGDGESAWTTPWTPKPPREATPSGCERHAVHGTVSQVSFTPPPLTKKVEDSSNTSPK